MGLKGSRRARWGWAWDIRIISVILVLWTTSGPASSQISRGPPNWEISLLSHITLWSPFLFFSFFIFLSLQLPFLYCTLILYLSLFLFLCIDNISVSTVSVSIWMCCGFFYQTILKEKDICHHRTVIYINQNKHKWRALNNNFNDFFKKEFLNMGNKVRSPGFESLVLLLTRCEALESLVSSHRLFLHF